MTDPHRPYPGPGGPDPGPDGPHRPYPGPRLLRAEPTPWATGSTVTVLVTVLVLVIDLMLTRALWAAFGWVWVPANLLVGAGLAPSIWLLRRVPTWRWVAWGVAAGLALAWVGLALGLLFRA